MNVAIIPARGGSKRIPRKNIKSFNGRPMIAYSILSAKKTGLFDRIIVSTDDEEIGNISKQFGAEVPFVRPTSLSDDLTPTVPVIAHALKECADMGMAIDYACCIYPCAPLLQSDDIVNAYQMMVDKKTNFVYPVAEYPHPIQRALRKLPSGGMKFLYPEHELTRTQDLEALYHDTGQFYWGTTDAWTKGLRMHTDGVGFIVPNYRIVDIDSDDDWHKAEILFRTINNAQ